MATIALSLELPPAELMRRLPRRAGAFLLDGGDRRSWARGEALLGWEPTAIVTRSDTPPAGDADPFALLERSAGGACAGVVCALGYDLGRCLENLGPPPPGDAALPRFFAAVHPWVLAYSYGERRYQLRSPHLDQRELAEVAARLAAAASMAPAAAPRQQAAAVASNFTRDEYLAAVRKVLEYIAAGDVYQVNLSQCFRAPTSIEPAELFARMLARHPAPFAGYLDGGDWALASVSPECFLARRGECVATYPIKGTRPRGETRACDIQMASGLRSSVKDRAEHLMIVDLERNDLGRVCRTGSVRVPSLAHLLTLPSLHHLESEVVGLLPPHASLAALLRATFPGGSISGAPKIRAMQIIDELETVGRDFYTGALGFVAGEEATFNVAIRTATLRAGEVRYHAGGGIVADSDPAAEYDETHLKARAFFDTLAEAEA